MSRDRRPRPAAPTPGSPASSPVEGSGASSVGLQNGNGVDPARARVSATRKRVATPASKGVALPSARSGLAGCGGSGLWLSRRHPPAGAAPYRNAGAESGARAASAGRGPQRGQGDQALRRPPGKAHGTAEARMDGGHGRKASGASAPWLSQRRASGAPGDRRRQAADISSANGFLGATGSGPAARPVQGPGLQGQVTTATPVRSR